MSQLKERLRELLNSECRENESNTPDHILADYMVACLEAYEAAVYNRDKWYGIRPAPSKPFRKWSDQ